MPIIVGLGNPGKEYESTYHNTGWRAVDKLAEKLEKKIKKAECSALIWTGTVGGERVVLAKPLTYMNLSGNSVIKAASYYKIMPQEIVVIHDDMDLLPGQIKVKRGGGSGGHNGLKSIDAHIGSDYNRIRIGVGRPQGRGEAVVSHVLSRFSRADKEQLNEEIRLIAENIPVLLSDGAAALANKLGMLLKKEKK